MNAKKRITARSAIFAAFAAAALLLLLTGAAQAAASLPDVEGWTASEVRVSELAAVSGNQGEWIERKYRTDQGLSVTATLMTGKGPKMRRFPAASGERDGPLGRGLTFDLLEIMGKRAIVEKDPLLGAVIFIDLGDGYLTLESYEATPENLRYAAEGLLSVMQ